MLSDHANAQLRSPIDLDNLRFEGIRVVRRDGSQQGPGLLRRSTPYDL
ncbi:uncharacterized protein METZ01_LOCUS492679, partial [marine metagenome]